MLEFKLPKGTTQTTTIQVVDDLCCLPANSLPEPCLSLGFDFELDLGKLRISQFDAKKWIQARDDTYPLSYLKGSGDAKKRRAIKTKRIPSANPGLVPRSRSFFKMIELLDAYPYCLVFW